MTFLNQCIFYQNKDVHKIEDNPNKEFSHSANGLSITNYKFVLGKIKERAFFFLRKKICDVFSSCGNHGIMQCQTTKYLGCYLDSNLSTAPKKIKILKKTNEKFLHRKSKYSTIRLKRLPCNVLI